MGKKTYNIQCSKEELITISHGLKSFYDNLADTLAAVTPQMHGAQDLKNYYKAQMVNVTDQMKSYNDLLTSQTNESGQ